MRSLLRLNIVRYLIAVNYKWQNKSNIASISEPGTFMHDNLNKSTLITMRRILDYLLKALRVILKWVSINSMEFHHKPDCTCSKKFIAAVILAGNVWVNHVAAQQVKPQLKVGVYYFDGWAGQNPKANDLNEPWAKNAPSHLTRRLVEEFSDREPVWGWRDDSQEIMERQIDLAADNGIEFFLFCWYWRDNKGPINPDAIKNIDLHTSLNLYLKAKNKNRIKFGLLVANHEGAEISGTENWRKATEFWMKYFKDPQYITVDSKPLVVIFEQEGIDNDALASMQDFSKKQGLPGLSIAGCWAPKNKNFTVKTHYNIIPGYTGGSEEHKYAELVDAHKKEWAGTKKQPFIPELTVGWDKRPWEENKERGGEKKSWYYVDRTHEQFRNFVTDAITWMDQHPDQTTKERIILLYAWNELGEGGYLVPTKGDPDASYLKVVRSIVNGE
jgi:hypothetical protein